MDAVVQAAIVEALNDLIGDLAPDANLRPMYGGTVIELVADTPKSRIGGIYAYAEHVSFEFATGAAFDDPNGVLEGTGKSRRHVKLYTVEDIATKTCGPFLEQAIALRQND